jgi:ribosomal RNA small subunit methyltransferase A
LPSQKFRPKQSLGQNFLVDQNTINKFIDCFHKDAQLASHAAARSPLKIVELGPGAGALTNVLVDRYPPTQIQCLEIDQRAVALLRANFPLLNVTHADVLHADYTKINEDMGGEHGIAVIGNLPYYITSQILFSLADASHFDSVRSATVTMQREVGERMVAKTRTKDYGILSVVFQLYCDVRMHFKMKNTVFYPKPKVESALIGLNFVGSAELRRRLKGVRPKDLQRVVKSAFGERRKVIRNTMRKLLQETYGGKVEEVARRLEVIVERGWAGKRAEELAPAEFVDLTQVILGVTNENVDTYELGIKIWRKEKHGPQDGDDGGMENEGADEDDETTS